MCSQVKLEGGSKVNFDEPAYSLHLSAQGDFSSTVLMLSYSSLTTPTSTLAHNMATGERATKKTMPVRGGFNADDYVTERLWAPSHDRVKVSPARTFGC